MKTRTERGCPELSDLWEFVDGEASSSRRLAIRDHLGACHECGRRLASMRRTRGEFLAGPASDLAEGGFEARFRDRLLDRLATGDERRALQARPWAVGLAAAASLLLGMGLWALFADAAPDDGLVARRASVAAAEERHRAAREAALRLDEARLDLHDWLARHRVGLGESELEVLDRFERRFAALGSRLTAQLSQMLERGSEGIARPVLDALGREGRSTEIAPIRRFLVDRRPDAETRRAALDAAARIGGPGALRLLAVEARSGEAADAALEKLAASADERAWRSLEELVGELDEERESLLVTALASSPDPRAERLMRQLLLEGRQSLRLERALLLREGTSAWVRAGLAEGPRSRLARSRLLRLAGRLGDVETVPSIARLVSRHPGETEPLEALARIGGDEAWKRLAAELALSARRSRSPEAARRHDAARLVLRSVEPGVAKALLGLAENEAGQVGRRLVLAAGYCGDEDAVPLLRRAAERDEYEREAVEALESMGGDAAFAALEALAADRDLRLARFAREALRRLSERELERAADEEEAVVKSAGWTTR